MQPFNGFVLYSEDNGSEEGDEDMDAGAEKQTGEVAQALAVADALGKTSKSKSGTQLEDLTDGLKELDMEHYDEEDDGISAWMIYWFYLLLPFISFILLLFRMDDLQLILKHFQIVEFDINYDWLCLAICVMFDIYLMKHLCIVGVRY